MFRGIVVLIPMMELCDPAAPLGYRVVANRKVVPPKTRLRKPKEPQQLGRSRSDDVERQSTVFRINGIPIGDEALRVLRSEIEYPSLEDDEYISTLKAALAGSGEVPPFNELTEDRLATAIVKAAVQPELSTDERGSLRVCIEIIPSCYFDNKRCALLYFSWPGKRRPLNDDRAPPIPKFVFDNRGKLREEFQLPVDDVILNVDQHFYGMT
ncbi:hypothetical protein BDD12DRAFT_910353 [Trichophaea hybrida]|nr:hypothetical protein BDD12DRAFT_910353 [Trichophaea hybrida]